MSLNAPLFVTKGKIYLKNERTVRSFSLNYVSVKSSGKVSIFDC